MKQSIAFTVENHQLRPHANVGHSNGYVALPEEHPCFGMEYDAIHSKYDIDIHGGLTLSKTAGNGIGDEYPGMWIVGFDTCHYMDTIDGWPLERVQAEANRLKEQLDKVPAIPEPETIDFDTLIGQTGKLYLCADQSPNTFQLGRVIFEVVEDESDGYRSMMRHVLIKSKSASVAHNTVLATVLIRKAISNDMYRTFEGYELMDVNTGHAWLKFGTDNNDDYYPCFTYYWTPTSEVTIGDNDSEIYNLIKQ